MAAAPAQAYLGDVRAAHHPRRERPQVVTEARKPLSQDIAYRERRYLIMMGIRLICFVVAVVLFVNGAGWLTAIPAVGAIVIPYFAVVFANGGREPPAAGCGPTSRTCRSGSCRPRTTSPRAKLPIRALLNPELASLARATFRARTARLVAAVERVTKGRGKNGASRVIGASGCRRFACSPVLTHKGGVRCNMFAGALVPRRGTDAGVPGPRRSADECDAGWFAPVATRRRSLFSSACSQPGNRLTRSCGTRRSRSPSW